MRRKKQILLLLAAFVLVGCRTWQSPEMAVLWFDDTTLTVTVAGATRQYSLSPPKGTISTTEVFPHVPPGWRMVKFQPKCQKRGTETIDTSLLHLQTDDGHAIVLTHALTASI